MGVFIFVRIWKVICGVLVVMIFGWWVGYDGVFCVDVGVCWCVVGCDGLFCVVVVVVGCVDELDY